MERGRWWVSWARPRSRGASDKGGWRTPRVFRSSLQNKSCSIKALVKIQTSVDAPYSLKPIKIFFNRPPSMIASFRINHAINTRIGTFRGTSQRYLSSIHPSLNPTVPFRIPCFMHSQKLHRRAFVHCPGDGEVRCKDSRASVQGRCHRAF